ncbi:helix-turn-helix domain-containing protein [Streptomyces sp. NPDC098781]|uniref:helix-turn-helix domain-containing protein n=1 Tax=Streptomyces sp. NPDC098781 TaxID=3366097 RepID=UPI00380BCA69
MGRRINVLPDDGRPLTGFALALRALRENSGSPSLTRLAKKTGYAQPRLSELFNARRVPHDDLVHDVVQALGGDPQAWLARLKTLREAEEEFQAAAERQGDSPEARLARLEYENKRLLTLTLHPDSVIAQANSAAEAAAARMERATALEAQARSVLSEAMAQVQQAHERMPDVERQAESILAEARAKADRHVLLARMEHDQIVQEANDRADAVRRKAQQEASALKQRAIEDAKAHREKAAAQTDRMLSEVDLLRGEAEQAVQRSETQRSNMERRAKIEIERLVRAVQKGLDTVGAAEEAHLLELLLIDFNINESHTEVKGRHARRQPETGPATDSPAQVAEAAIPGQAPQPVDADDAQLWRPWGFPQRQV